MRPLMYRRVHRGSRPVVELSAWGRSKIEISEETVEYETSDGKYAYPRAVIAPWFPRRSRETTVSYRSLSLRVSKLKKWRNNQFLILKQIFTLEIRVEEIRVVQEGKQHC